MKQLLPWIRILKIWNSDTQKHNSFLNQPRSLILIFMLTAIMVQPAHSQINDNGNQHNVGTAGEYQDLLLPNNPQIVAISFGLTGGDGGYARVHDVNPIPGVSSEVIYKSNGGAGASVGATFPVGSGPGEIPLGSSIRFVVGEKGQSGSKSGYLGTRSIWGGGGGGSAVLYSPPGSTGWTLLAVAGGGGGAYQGMTGYLPDVSKSGQGGRSGENGGAGNGYPFISHDGGSGGAGGDGSGNAGAGGGAYTNGGGITCISTTVAEGGAGGTSVGYGGSDDGCPIFLLDTWSNGGGGYGGGGAGMSAGGGGGGYSGGGAGDEGGRGGGGGSYVSPLSTSYSITPGGTTGSPDNGSSAYLVTLNQPPVAKCKSATIYLSKWEQYSITLTPDDVNDGSFDPLYGPNGVSLSLDKTKFSCNDIGSNTVTLTVTDNHGATDDCHATVTVVDNIAPNAQCKDITVQLSQAGTATITADDVDGGSWDNCSVLNKSLDITSFDCSDVGSPVTVTLTVKDLSGNQDECTAIVTLEDNVAPNAQCKDITIQLDVDGDASITADQLNDGSSDACGLDPNTPFVASQTTFDCGDVGDNEVMLTVRDANGNESICTSTVTVQDNVVPHAKCKDITIQLDDNGVATIAANQLDDGSRDACGLDLYTPFIASKTTFDSGDIGNNEVILTVRDANGNESTCTSRVTVPDNVPPDAICKDITVQLDDYGHAWITADNVDGGSTDNCSIDSKSIDVSLFTCADVGTPVTVTLTVADLSGNQDNCEATVTVLDTISPDAVCQNITVYLDANGDASITADDVDGGSTDNCSIDSKSIDVSLFTCADVGTPVTVTLTVADPSGNQDNCEATVTVLDTISPDAVCQNITVYLDANGGASITADDVDGGSTDNCSIDSKSIDVSSFTCADVGTPVRVTLTVADPSGNQDNCEATVTVLDTISPDAVCQNITVYLDANGDVSITADDVDGGSTDNCSIDSKSIDVSLFTCADVGTPVTVTLTVADPSGNQDNCEATVTVLDTISPDAVCQNITVYLDANGDASITAGDVDGGSTDNCSIDSKSIDVSLFTCADVGTPVTVTLTVADLSGNQDNCEATVTVLDTISPDAVCQDITVYLDANGDASITADDVDGGSTDNCSIDSKSIDVSSFTCADVGTPVTVTLTVADPSGNQDNGETTVTVLDTISPDAVCQNITVYLDASGGASITVDQLDDGSSDACGLDPNTPFMASRTTFDCGEVGDNEVTLTVMDANGNESSCTSTVTVQDTISPDAVCQDITVQLNARGNASIIAADIDGGSTDDCGIASLAASKTAFTCADLGNNNIILTATDVNGNPATCNAIVTVEDNIRPTVRTQNITVLLNKQGKASVSVNMIDNGSSDNCSIVDMWLEGETEFDCGSMGEHRVVLKAEDQSGNVGSNIAIVTVKLYKPDFRNKYGVANGDTIHLVDCQVPRDISRYDLDYKAIKPYATVRTHLYREKPPENAPWSMYDLWRYEYIVKDACFHTYKFSYYVALYDLAPPHYQSFPSDTTVATSADVPPVDDGVKIIDVCQYVVWDTVMIMPVLHPQSGDTLGYTRRWMARDPSGHQSFRDQMIWLGSGNRKQYSMITGRIADEDHIRNAKFAGEAGTNGLPVSLFRLDEEAGTRRYVSTWMTGDWAPVHLRRMGAQGTYCFLPEQPGKYQVKIDSAICLVDTLKFNKQLWSDTFTVAAGESFDQGWVITRSCIGAEVGEPQAKVNGAIRDGSSIQDKHKDQAWNLYPNPASGYLIIDINSDEKMNYRIYDALGRLVKTGVYQRGQTIDIGGLNGGLYHLQLRDQKEILGTKRVLLME